jgi:hypothetical protein
MTGKILPALQARIRQDSGTMKTFTASLIALSLLGSAGTALACSQVMEAETMPRTWDDATLPVGGLIYVRAGDEAMFEQEYATITDPEGAPVIWEFIALDFSSDILGIQPGGGWLVGDYSGGWFAEDGIFRTVVDEVDTTAPVTAIESWTGQNSRPRSAFIMDSCGGDGSQPAGLLVAMDDPGEPVIYQVEVDHLGPQEWDGTDFVVFWDSFLVQTAQGDKVDLSITAFDLSGNSSTVELNAAKGCAGSGSSMAAGPGVGILVLLAMGFVGSVRLRRHEGDLSEG